MIGDRAAILAPQGLDYVAAFLGALHAGFIAVPLSVPQFGSHDERISSALRDSLPAVILTTSSAVDEVTKYAGDEDVRSTPFVVEVDSLDLHSARELDANRYPHPNGAYLQYTSGSTRDPAGVVVSHKNVITNLGQIMSDYFEDPGKVPSTSVSWLPFYHDMGLIQGIFAPLMFKRSAVLLSPVSFLQRPARWMQLLAQHDGTFSAAPNFAFELAVRRTSDDDMAGLDLGDVRGIISGSERIHAATLKRFTERFARFNLSDTVVRPSYGLAEATVYVATPQPGRPPKTVRFEYREVVSRPCEAMREPSGVAPSWSVTAPCALALVRIVNPDTAMENPAGAIGEIWVHGENVALGYWRNPPADRAHVRCKAAQPVAWHARRSVAADRRSGA